VVFADLVVVQSGLVFGELEGFLHGPAGSGDPDQFGQRDRGGGVDDVVGQLGWCADGAADQQLVGVGAGVQEQPVIETLAFAAGAGREA